MTFSSLLLFQANLLNHIQNQYPNHTIPALQKSIFEHGISATFIGTFLFRIGHEIIWCGFSSKTRVILSLLCMMSSMFLLSTIYFILNSKRCEWIILCNLLGGAGVGAIESNLLSSILPLGDGTKLFALYGISLGFNFMAVAGFYLLSIGLPLICIYSTCFNLCFLSIFLYLRIIKQIPLFVVTNNSSMDIRVQSSMLLNPLHNKENVMCASMRITEFKLMLTEYKEWLPQVVAYGILLTLDLFSMNFFCTISG